jgi:type I restriction enzyme R subunit
MKLLIVVDKLLTGFDSPPCSYLYIDKSMQDHGLFQAICRTNRLDSDDKDFGYIVDYRDLFKKVENAIAVYTSEIAQSAGGVDPGILLQDRLKRGKERLDDSLEALSLICEPVQPPRGDLEHIHYFCGNTEIPTDLKEREPQRDALYKATVALIRAYASIADELEQAGYSTSDSERIAKELDKYLKLREIIRKASGESIDLKAYEADMRHLIDTYIETSAPRVISPFAGLPLLEIIVKTGIGEAIAEELAGMKGNEEAVSETIENNVRSKIIKEHLNDPAFYDRMSVLLDELIKARKEKAIEYEEYLQKIAELAKQVVAGHDANLAEPLKRSPALRSLYNNLKKDVEAGEMPDFAETSPEWVMEGDPILNLAVSLDQAIRKNAHDGWRGVLTREKAVKRAMHSILQSPEEVERLFPIIKQQQEY